MAVADTTTANAAAAAPLYFEDLAVGPLGESAAVEMTEAAIIAYARDYDPQPFHTDPAAAGDSFFGGLVASGWHTASVTMKLMVEGPVRIAGGIVGAKTEVKWPRATKPGDILRVVVEVEALDPEGPRPDLGWCRLRAVTLTQRDEAAQVLIAHLIVPKRG